MIISKADVHKHLGIWLDSTLSWDSHIDNICAKANRVLGLIRRTFGTKNKKGIEVAFQALVLPSLEYGCPVWNPHLKKHIHGCFGIGAKETFPTYLWLVVTLC